MNPRLSVIIASLNEPSHLWSTIASFREQIVDSGHTAEIIIGDNAPDKPNECRGKFHNVKWVPVETRSTSIVRNMPAAQATGDILCFSDTHVVLSNGLIRKAFDAFEKNKYLGLLHTHTIFWGNGDGYLSFRLDIEEKFNGCNCNKIMNPHNPYLIPASGHGLYFIRRSVFEKIGGYLESQIGWGGEEMFVDLLVWMHGYEVMVDPNAIHWHMPVELGRPTGRNLARYLINNLSAAYVLGGEELLNSCVNYYKLIEYDLVTRSYATIIRENEERRKIILKSSEYTLSQVIKMFDDYDMDWREK